MGHGLTRPKQKQFQSVHVHGGMVTDAMHNNTFDGRLVSGNAHSKLKADTDSEVDARHREQEETARRIREHVRTSQMDKNKFTACIAMPAYIALCHT